MRDINNLLSRALEMRKELLDYNLRLKEEFLSQVSHELRSPLTAIHQFTTIILDGLAGEITEKQKEYLSICLTNIRELQRMIDELLIATRARSGSLGVRKDLIWIPDVVSESVEALRGLADQKGVELRTSEASSLPDAFADRRLIGQVLIHLIHNGIKFTPAGGSVCVHSSVKGSREEELIVEVRDTGPGFPPELATRVFERLNEPANRDSEGRRGLGLGLFICQELVSRQNGSIWVQDSPAEGSVLCFTVPVFSISRLIAPVVSNPKRSRDSLELISVEVRCEPQRADSIPLCDAFRESLRLRLVPGMEALLPTRQSDVALASFQIIAGAEVNSGQTGLDRVREHLSRSKRISRLGLSYLVSSVAIEPLPKVQAEREGELLERISRKVSSLLLSPRLGLASKDSVAALSQVPEVSA